MHNDWILDVIADLGTFARDNRLVALAADLERAATTARREMMAGAAGDMTGEAECARGRLRPDLAVIHAG